MVHTSMLLGKKQQVIQYGVTCCFLLDDEPMPSYHYGRQGQDGHLDQHRQ